METYLYLSLTLTLTSPFRVDLRVELLVVKSNNSTWLNKAAATQTQHTSFSHSAKQHRLNKVHGFKPIILTRSVLLKIKQVQETNMGLFSGKCVSKARLDGKTAIVTGSNTGIGKETVKDFFLRGARVIMACRNVDKANEAAEDIKKQCKGCQNLGELQVAPLDLTSLNSVRLCAKKILETESRVDLLINNAGVMLCPKTKTENGFEMQFGTNHLGHFLLTLLLLPKISQSTPARIVNVSSMAHNRGTIDFDDLNFERRPYSSLQAYQQSKLANILFTSELARRLEEADVKGVTAYSLHPGVIATELGRHLDTTYFTGARFIFGLFRWLLKTPEQGAQTTIYCAVDEKCANETGLYYSDCATATPTKQALNGEDAHRLWDDSLILVGLKNDFDPFKQ